MPVKVYNPDEVVITFGDDVLEGFADGEMILIEESSPRIIKIVGADGEVVISRHVDRSASITVKLLQTSDGNDVLYNAAELNRRGPGLPGVKPLYVRDLNGRALHEATHAWVEEAPQAHYDRSATAREWKLGAANLDNQLLGSGAA